MWMKWNSKETVNLLNVAFEGGGVMSEIMRTTDCLKVQHAPKKVIILILNPTHPQVMSVNATTSHSVG